MKKILIVSYVTFSLAYASNLNAAEKSRDFTTNSTLKAATLTCPPQSSGIRRQQIFIKTVDGKKTRGGWKAEAKSIRIDAGFHKISILYYYVGLSRTYDFEFTAEPGKSYLCVGRPKDNLMLVTIEDKDSGKIIADPNSMSKDCYGTTCSAN